MDTFQKRLLERGVYLPGHCLGCMNLATTDDDVGHLLEAVNGALDAPVTPAATV